MNPLLFRAAGAVTLVGGAAVDPRQLEAALALAPHAVAADGGGNLALPGGRAFEAVIGDMDLLKDPAAARAAGTALYAVREQDSTDLEKCLYSVEAPLFIGLGFLGGRIDHHLAAMSALVKFPGKPVVLIGGDGPVLPLPARARARAAGRDAGLALSDGAGAGPGVGGAALAGRRARAQPRGPDRHLERRTRRAGPGRVRRAPGARHPARDRARAGGGADSGRARLQLSTMVTASASVIVTSTRAPAPRLSAKLRRFGGTTARRVKPSGVRKVARPLLRS